MTKMLTRKYIAESAILFISLAIGVAIFSWFRVWIVGELDTAQFRQIIDLLPKNWRQFASVDFDWLVSYLGRTSLTLDEPMLITLVCAWGLVRGSDVVSGELGRGTLEMLLSQPLSRKRVYLHHALITVGGLFALVFICWAGMALGIWTTSVTETTYPAIRIPIIDYSIPLTFLPAKQETIEMGSVVHPFMFLPGVFNFLCLSFCFAGFAAFCSACDRYRWRTLGVVAAFFFANAGMKILGMGSEKLAWVENCCLFGLYHPASAIERAQAQPGAQFWLYEYGNSGAIHRLGSFPNSILLVAIGLMFYWLGLKIFIRRDLPAPM